MKPEFRKHQNASRIPKGSSVRAVQFPSLEEKARWLDAAASLDALRGNVQDFVRRFLEVEGAEARTRAIHRWVRDHVHYEQDFRVSVGVPGEEFVDTETMIRRGYADCDDKARGFVALVRAAEMLRPLGVEARIRSVFVRHPLAFVHVQVEVRWPRSQFDERAQPDGWLLAEMILKNCEIGEDPDQCPRGPRDERLIA